MNRDICIAKIKRQQAEIQEMIVALNEEGDKFPRIAKALKILHKNSLDLISTSAMVTILLALHHHFPLP